jgi:hypothetical protein
VFGSPEPEQGVPVRVAVSVPVCLSFPELLGLLVFGAGAGLLVEDLDDEAAIGETLQAALLMSDLFAMEGNAARAMAAYAGRPGFDAEMVGYVRAVAVAVTRVFGLPAPALVAQARVSAGRRGPWGDES